MSRKYFFTLKSEYKHLTFIYHPNVLCANLLPALFVFCLSVLAFVTLCFANGSLLTLSLSYSQKTHLLANRRLASLGQALDLLVSIS